MNIFEEKTDRISEHARKWDENKIKEHYNIPKDYIPMWIADMDFKMAENIAKRLKESIEYGVLGYTYTYDEFYKAVIDWHKKRRNVEIKKEWITLTYGTVSTIHYIIQCFCKSSDSIIINTPVYEPFDSAAKKQEVKRVYSNLVIKENRYYIDLKDLEEKMSLYKPKIYFLCSPHNPSGRIWSKEEIEQIIQICKKHNVLLIVDEVHGEHINKGSFHSIAEWLNEEDDIILLTSPNKAFNIGGLKTSYAVIAKNKLNEFFKIQLEKNSITSPNAFGIKATIAAYDECEEWLDDMIEYVNENYIYLKNQIESGDLKKLKLMEMEASYLAWVNIEETKFKTEEFVVKLAEEEGVILESGKHFVTNGEGWVRINLGTQKEHIVEACKRIAKIIK